MPSFLGGLNGSVVYIETNCNFSSKRIKGAKTLFISPLFFHVEQFLKFCSLLEIHSSCSAHCANVSKELPCSSNDDQHSQLQDFIERNPLSRITKYSVESMEELRSSILMTKLMLENQTNNVSTEVKIFIVIISFVWSQTKFNPYLILFCVDQTNRCRQLHFSFLHNRYELGTN